MFIVLNTFFLLAEEYITLPTLLEKLTISENLRNELLQKIPNQLPWETDEEYNCKIKQEITENKEFQKIMTDFLLENYLLSISKYPINTSYAIIMPHGFSRERKGWDFFINTCSEIFPNRLNVFYQLVIDENVNVKYDKIEALINKKEFSFDIDINISHKSYYELYTLLKFLNVDIKKAIEDNIFVILGDIISYPNKYYIDDNDSYVLSWIEDRAFDLLQYFNSLKWLSDEYTIYLSDIKLFNDSVSVSKYPDTGAAYFNYSTPNLIRPIESER